MKREREPNSSGSDDDEDPNQPRKRKKRKKMRFGRKRKNIEFEHNGDVERKKKANEVLSLHHSKLFKVRDFRDSDILKCIDEDQDFLIEDVVNLGRSDMAHIKAKAKKDELIFIGREYPTGGAKSFICTNLKTLTKMVSSIAPNKRRFHEMFLGNRLTKGVFDIEVDVEMNEDYNFVAFLHYFIKNLVIFFHGMELSDVHESWVSIEDSSRDLKHSVHASMYKGYVFKDIKTWSYFQVVFTRWLLKKEIINMKKLLRAKSTEFIKPDERGRISLLSRIKETKEMTSPSTAYPFGLKVEDSHPSKHLLHLFRSVVDLQPMRAGGSLRCYNSIKAGHEDDERYRLKLAKIEVVDEKSKKFRLKIEEKLDVNKIQHHLRQVVIKEVEEVKTRVIKLGRRRVDFELIKNDFETNLLYQYTMLYYRLHGSGYPGMAEPIYGDIAMRINGDETNDEGNDGKFVKMFGSMYDKNFRGLDFNKREGGARNGRYSGGGGSDCDCKIKLFKSDNHVLYIQLQRILNAYGTCQYIQELFGGPLVPKLKMVKTNEKHDCLLLNVEGRCEIVRKTWGRMHENHQKSRYTPGVWFRLWPGTGLMYQRCMKDACSNGNVTRGHNFNVPDDVMRIIRGCIWKVGEKINQ